MKPQRWLLVTLLVPSVSAFACGACDEDRIASTYDHAVIARAAAQQRVMVFAAVDGHGSAAVLAASAKRAAAKVPGIDRGSIRSAAEPGAAVSFALDSHTSTPEQALDAIARNSAQKGLRLTMLKVMP